MMVETQTQNRIAKQQQNPHDHLTTYLCLFSFFLFLSKLNSLAGRCYVQLTPKEWGLMLHLLERKYLPELLRILHDKICLFSHSL